MAVGMHQGSSPRRADHADGLTWARFVLSLFLLGSLTLSVTLAAQTQEATVFGTVTDESGGVLPGVTVTIKSPALQVPDIVAVTDANGEYRIAALPLGVYSVEFTLSGFQTHWNEGLRLTAGFVARMDTALKVGALEESVTVSGESPVVDVKSTAAGTQVTQEILESIPTARNGFNSLLTLAAGSRPEVDTGEVRGKDPVFKAFGRSNNAWVTIDGLSVTAPTESSSGFQTAFNFSSVDEAQVTTLSSGAEAPTSGMQLNVITKSGGNQLHGTAMLADTADWMQGDNLNDRLISQGITSAVQYDERWDTGGDVGGKIVHDKLWFYGAARMRQEAIGILGSFMADGSQSQFTTDQRFASAKLTNQLTSSQKLLGTFHWRRQFRFNGPETRFHDVDTLRSTTYYTKQGMAQWQTVKNNKVLAVQGGGHFVLFPVAPQYTTNSSWMDEVTGRIGGLEEKGGEKTDMSRWEAKATLSWYKPDFAWGNHDFRMGANYTVAHREAITVDRGEPIGNYVLNYRNEVPFSILIKNAPVTPISRLGYLGLFLQDSWSLNRRLTLNLGVRYAYDAAWLPDQCRDAAPGPFAVLFPAECWDNTNLNSWDSFVPRMHMAYDVSGNGKTVIKGGWGRFKEMHSQDELNIFNPNAKKQATFLWRDLNSNRRFDAGESDLSFSSNDFVSIAIPGLDAFSGLVDNPDLKTPGSDEFSLSIERELMGNFGIRGTGVYVREFNAIRLANRARPYEVYNIAITNPDPGPDGRLNSEDDPGTFLTYYDYPASLRGATFQQPIFINHSGSNANYTSFEIAAFKRLSSRWQLLTSYSATKRDIPVPKKAPFDPNTEINAADNTWEWLFRSTGSYHFPWDLQASANILVQSGDPWARTVSVRGGAQIPSITLRAEAIGDHRNQTASTVALSVEKGFRFYGSHRLTVGGSVLNLFNASFDMSVQQPRSGATFGYSTQVSPPRVGEIVLRYTF